jgi:hypothetical protein
MTRHKLTLSVFAASLIGSIAWGGIPEPDAILYGSARIQGVDVQRNHPVSVIARLADPGGAEWTYRFDDALPNDCNRNGIPDVCDLDCECPCTPNPQAGISCPPPGCGMSKDVNPQDGIPDECPGDNFVLRIRLEHLLPGETQSPDVALIGQTLDIYLQKKGGPEMFVRSVLISTRGMLRNLALATLDLFTFAEGLSCFAGPGATSIPGGCSPGVFDAMDFDLDGDADLKDFMVFQNSFVGQ